MKLNMLLLFDNNALVCLSVVTGSGAGVGVLCTFSHDGRYKMCC